MYNPSAYPLIVKYPDWNSIAIGFSRLSSATSKKPLRLEAGRAEIGIKK